MHERRTAASAVCDWKLTIICPCFCCSMKDKKTLILKLENWGYQRKQIWFLSFHSVSKRKKNTLSVQAKEACGEWTSKHVKQVERQGCKKNLTQGTTWCLTICSDFSSPQSCRGLLSYLFPALHDFIYSMVCDLMMVGAIYLLESSWGLGCSRLLIRGHFLEAGAWRVPGQGVFLSHIPDVLLRPT